jgi:ABC-type transport system involved in multi-copper enzyme maturation permease subunit
MKALLWKDWHVNRVVMQATTAGCVLPYFVSTWMNLMSYWRNGNYVPWSEMLTISGLFGLAISILLVALLGGNAIAGERADRSAEFFAYLPVPRRHALLSRLAVVLSAALLVWLINLAVLYWLAPHVGAMTSSDARAFAADRRKFVPLIAVTAGLAFGTAWLCSSLLSSPSIAAAVGILAPGALSLVLVTLREIADVRHTTFDIVPWYVGLAPAIGLIFFAAGCVYYLRRVEP